MSGPDILKRIAQGSFEMRNIPKLLETSHNGKVYMLRAQIDTRLKREKLTARSGACREISACVACVRAVRSGSFSLFKRVSI
jgi:hypothetical protein